ncbi:LLM class flavin-dependent oxidoreductase [Saccharomonospora xinjiangensis]|uniref:LLM class flavin-dependent oxidoreductase n=1 Tax=Saccharomonospora xinjiangensis TaxID=75294 RepID=UPI00106FC69A|nr:LLM class flavin-dependent oxidoreductase [Saccharomonospora xinjiangensis]QBQ60741.1 Dimethyl-sulfide monooxygenase [Saccharomonospora xinjiangensis]
MHLNLFTECAPVPSFEGLWRDPHDRTAAGYGSLGYWTSVARKLEDACFDALFFADVHGTYDVYEGSWAAAVRNGVQIPSIDPVPLIPALAAVTDRLGFAVTYSTTYHPPYLCARVLSTLDHLTQGRIAWNIVTSYLRSASENGIGEFLEHDQRYDRADEYLAVVRALWERSWDDDAVRIDREGGVFADPERVHQIDHHGRWFDVRGPHQCAPTPQRTPVLYQAGTSGRGLRFAAEHAEVVFVTLADPRRGAEVVADLRRKVAEAGRDPSSVTVLQGMPVVVGATTEQAKARLALMERFHSAEGRVAKWCGWTGIDLAGHPDDLPLSDLPVQGSRSALDAVRRTDPSREWTVGDVRRTVSTVHLPMRGGRFMLCGSASEVADQMETWQEIAGVDGFNLVPFPPSTGIDDICDLLVPELRRRGLFRAAYDPAETTLRERYRGAGNARLPYPPRPASPREIPAG